MKSINDSKEIGNSNWMEKTILSILGILVCFCLYAQENKQYLNKLKRNHDLISLPEWGPYTKNYIGISHIPDIDKGVRFDLSVFPGIYRRKIEVPNVNFETNYYPWETAPNLDYFSFRHELEWKDEIYTDISYSKIDGNARLIRVEAVNNTPFPHNLVLQMMGSIHFPPIASYAPNDKLDVSTVNLPKQARWVNAIDYASADFVTKKPTDNLVRLGFMNGEYRMHNFVDGSGIHFDKSGDKLEYEEVLEKDLEEAVMLFRFAHSTSEGSINIRVGKREREILFQTKDTIFTVPVSLGKIKAGKISVAITLCEGELDFDGFTFVKKSDLKDVKFLPSKWDYVPELMEGPIPNTLIIKYKNIDIYYGLKWDYPDFEVRQWFYKELSDEFKRKVHDHVNDKFYDGSDGHFSNVFLRPIAIQPNSTKTIYAYSFSGSKEEVMKRLANGTRQNPEDIYEKARKSLVDFKGTTIPEGKPYIFSNRILAANTLGNIVYPVYTQKQYIRHYTPGRYWDILYTWDSGFIGLGLAQLNSKAAIEILNTYVNEPGEQSAFIQHGSFVPVQHYLFKEIWEKTHSEEFLKNFYPKLKYYYDFYVGKLGSSTTAELNSGLLQTWDYFYNSGGWDDYPPQKATHNKKNRELIAPVINTAHGIRIAKILKQAAQHLGIQRDIESYDQDIAVLSKALQDHSWHEPTGYYGYVVHDQNKNPTGILEYRDGVNFNMGLGGVYPIVADICTREQKNTLLKKLKKEGRLWSKIGLSAVDQAAPYYSREGYWNGAVWMPHQWFFWKAMLDYGEADFAFKISSTALDLWKKETDRTYNSYEHFMIETASGAGWHQFSGLSTPVLCWFNAYYKMGTLTTGHNAWIKSADWGMDNTTLKASLVLDYDEGETFSVVAVMNPEFNYQVYWNEEQIAYKQIHEGTLSISITADKMQKGMLEIKMIRE